MSTGRRILAGDRRNDDLGSQLAVAGSMGVSHGHLVTIRLVGVRLVVLDPRSRGLILLVAQRLVIGGKIDLAAMNLETAVDRFVTHASEWAGEHLALYAHSPTG